MRRWVAAVALLCIALAVQAADKGETTTQKARPTTKPKATTTPRTTTATAPKVTAGKRPGVPLGVRQQEEYVDPAIIKEVFDIKKDPSGERYGASPAGSYGGGHGGGPPLMEEEPLSQEFICSVFGGPSCPQDQPALDVPCECEGHELCHCVPYYQCDKGSGAYNEFGVGVIDIRNGNSNGNSSKNTEVGNRNGNSTCPHYIYKCCKTSTMGPPHQPTHEPYHPEPHPEPEPQHTEPPYHPPEHHTEPPYHPPEHHTEPPYHPPEQHTEPPYHPPEQHTQPPYHPKPEPEYPPPYPEHPEPHPEPEPYPTRPPPQHPEPHYPHQRMRCGQRNAEGVGVRITGDEDGEAQFGEFPWMVAILKVETSDDEKKRNLYQCGGALITPQVVLTAAHCVKKGGGFHHLKVRAGEWDTQTSKEMYRHQDVAVEHVIIHPDYYGGAVHNDVALLFLASPVHIGYHIGTICMPEQDANFDYQKCFVSGWGKDKFGQHGRYQVILKKLELPIVPHGHCQEQLRKTRLGQYFNLHHSFICAGGEEGRDTCKGDGGSPLVCPIPGEPGRYQLAGTVAWGIDCGLAGVPGVYGNVALFRHWVDEQLRSRNIADTPYIP